MRSSTVFACLLALVAAVPFVPANASSAPSPRLALLGIPAGSTIDSATFSIHVRVGSAATVNVHRITAAWDENSTTWNNFGGAYDPAVIDSFPGTVGWQSADITNLMQAWLNGTQPNYGILLEQGQTEYTNYDASEAADTTVRPLLDIFYTPPGGSQQELVLQRAGATPETVFDAYIWQLNPDNVGNWEELFTGLVGGMEKQTLVRFEFTIDQTGPGTGTPGFWKNHPEAWPVDSIVIGGVTYTKAQAIALMGRPDAGDKTFTMFRHLVAAKLNVLVGNESSCIDATIISADAWMALHPPGSHVGGGSAAWAVGAPLATTLDNYNNGLMCAPHRN
jgi:hypothetical protein